MAEVTVPSTEPLLKSEHRKLRWRPLSLKPTSLILFASTYLFTAIVLSSLAFVSHRNDGICNVNASGRFWWTYAPTACEYDAMSHEHQPTDIASLYLDLHTLAPGRLPL